MLWVIDPLSLQLMLLKGYDKAAHPVQILPKKIIKVNQLVISIALTVGILHFYSFRPYADLQ